MSKPNVNIYVLSDNHFLHGNIIKYCKRPFESVNDMNEQMITRWNSTVRATDIVIHLGDIAFTAGEAEILKTCLKRLQGRKILIKGNHDRKGNIWYLSNGIDFICDRMVWEYNGKRILFVHNPAHVSPEEKTKYDYVLHGHSHNNVPFVTYYGKCIFVNLSVEHLKYTPMALITLLNRLAQGYYNKSERNRK